MAERETVVWIDHKEARVVPLGGEPTRIPATPPDQEVHRPNKATASGRRGAHLHERYYRAVLEVLRPLGPLVLCGPSTAKLELSAYLQRTAPDVARRVLAVETVDHPSDRQLAAFGRKVFARFAEPE